MKKDLEEHQEKETAEREIEVIIMNNKHKTKKKTLRNKEMEKKK